MMEGISESKKAAKRKRQRQNRKRKTLESSEIKFQEEKQEENKPVEIESPKKEEEIVMNKTPEKSKEQILAERQAKKAAKQGRKSDVSDKQVEKVGTSPASAIKQAVQVPVISDSPQKPHETEKTKEQVMAEREAKRLAKQAAKKKDGTTPGATPAKPVATPGKPTVTPTKLDSTQGKSSATPVNSSSTPVSNQFVTPAPKSTPPQTSDSNLTEKLENLSITDSGETPGKKILSKAERRAIQEAQRAAKAKALEEKKSSTKKVSETPVKKMQEGKKLFETPAKTSPTLKPSTTTHKVKLFKHLYNEKCDFDIKVNQKIHPAVVKLGLQYANDLVVGSNARCYAFLNAMKVLINDYETPPEKLFCRGLEAELIPAIDFLQNCRPFAVSMTNALKYIKLLISQETTDGNDDDKKRRLLEKIDTYALEQIETAAIAISLKVREKISNGDVILTFGCSSLIKRTLIEAYRDSAIKFRVIVVDSRPDHEGRGMLKSLTMLGINCTYVLINAVSFVMPEVTKVLLGAHALLANGYVMSRVGTAQIALVAKSYNVPVLVCCETHKFSERVQTDAFVFNEIGDPNALVMNKNTREKSEFLKDWESITHLTPLNLRYDITPPELVTAVVTEVAILPCTSVQVILRVKPAE